MTDRVVHKVVMVRMSPELHESLKQRAYERRVSMNALCLSLLADGTDADRAAELAAAREEIARIVEIMDGVARQWGDEGVFRRCRDRLRALTERPAVDS